MANISSKKSERVKESNSFLLQTSISFARFVGSAKFILFQTIFVILWIIYNLYISEQILNIKAFDPYPFILLNLMISLQAAYLAPLILLGQTYKADVDTARDNADYEADIKSEKMLEQIVKEITIIKNKLEPNE